MRTNLEKSHINYADLRDIDRRSILHDPGKHPSLGKSSQWWNLAILGASDVYAESSRGI